MPVIGVAFDLASVSRHWSGYSLKRVAGHQTLGRWKNSVGRAALRKSKQHGLESVCQRPW